MASKPRIVEYRIDYPEERRRYSVHGEPFYEERHPSYRLRLTMELDGDALRAFLDWVEREWGLTPEGRRSRQGPALGAASGEDEGRALPGPATKLLKGG